MLKQNSNNKTFLSAQLSLQLSLLNYITVLRRLIPPIVNDRVAWSFGLSVGHAYNSEAIEIPFVFGTRVVGSGKTCYI